MSARKTIAIVRTGKAFLPEVEAYDRFLRNCGYDVRVIENENLDWQGCDAAIVFYGFFPFWRSAPPILIADYNSLSTGRWRRLKDLLKIALNKRANTLIFLNEDVRALLFHTRAAGTLIRGMGFEAALVERYRNSEKEFDLAYAGSPRAGVMEQIERMAVLGLKIALVGSTARSKHQNIYDFGRLTLTETYSIVAKAKIGINYVPNIPPWSFQDSTKVIEYCALGLGVLTNRYHWINQFERARNARFLDISTVTSKEDVLRFNYNVPEVADLSWERVLHRSGIEARLASHFAALERL